MERKENKMNEFKKELDAYKVQQATKRKIALQDLLQHFIYSAERRDEEYNTLREEHVKLMNQLPKELAHALYANQRKQIAMFMRWAAYGTYTAVLDMSAVLEYLHFEDEVTKIHWTPDIDFAPFDYPDWLFK